MNPDVEAFFGRVKMWKEELLQLRTIMLECGLTEDFKWRTPCYTYQDGNVIILNGFKEHCVLGFFKGALLKDPKQILIKPGEQTQSSRMMKFTSLEEIRKNEKIIKTYIKEAIEIEKSGLKVELKPHAEYEVPAELQQKLNTDKKFKAAFDTLTPGRQRAYYMFIAQAKQAATRVSRVDGCTARIMMGKGLNDCICGHSKRMPMCDGQHKFFK
jgi:uncharacterized protein YdeI (YjbR/CyaY-like superfamily)